jgi:Kdo2-lipid IVA lauroyltransferase/acyltransferase
MQLLGYLILYPFLWIISSLPLRFLYIISDGLYYLIFYVLKYRKKVVYSNLQKSFPEKSFDEIDQIAKKFFRYFSQLLVEMIKTFNISEQELRRRFKYRNPELLYELYNKGLYCVVVTAHYGNWEWLSISNAYPPYRTMSLYKPLSNKYIDRLFYKMRTRFGSELIPMNSLLRATIRYKRDGIPTLSCFIADQSPIRQHIQYWTTFLNQDTPIFTGAEKVARQTNQGVLYMKIIPVRKGYYEIEFVKLFENVTNVPENEITEAHVRILEQIIKERPEYWLWTHRRWKHSSLRPKENINEK